MASGSNILQAALEGKLAEVRHFLHLDPGSVKKSDKKGHSLRVPESGIFVGLADYGWLINPFFQCEKKNQVELRCIALHTVGAAA